MTPDTNNEAGKDGAMPSGKDGALQPTADRAVAASPSSPSVSPVPASIPSAEELWQSLCFLGKWIERGMFDPDIPEREALSVMAWYPGMPWNSRRWDVDHKPYAAVYYRTFPRTAAQAMSAGTAETAQQAQGQSPASAVRDSECAQSEPRS